MYVLMITPNNFPNGDAGAIRDGYFAQIYQKLGYEVFYIGLNPKEKKGKWKAITYYSLYRENSGFINKLYNNISYSTRLISIYNQIKQKKGIPALIHIYDIPEQGIIWAKKLGGNNHIPVIHDSVEWYSPSQFALGKFSYPYILKDRTNRKIIDKPIAVIAISRYLENHFRKKGLAVIRIPVIMNSKDYRPSLRDENSKIRLVYAGSPSKKDYLAECVQAFAKLSNEMQERFEFHILGVDKKFVEKCCDGIVPSAITAHGRVTREEVIKCLETSDFALLLRPKKERYTKAGFPTKSVEAMMNGCAMICNLTSDLDLYLADGINAVIVKDSTISSMEEALVHVSKLTHEELVKLRDASRKTAEENFDYNLYVKELKEFIASLKN